MGTIMEHGLQPMFATLVATNLGGAEIALFIGLKITVEQEVCKLIA